jgi:probable phosphoglycerate mutase
MTSIVLIRHGESEGNRERRFGGHTATPLSARGRAQAEAAGRVLLPEGADALYSSDLVRARETAEIIGTALGLLPMLTAALRERTLGALDGLRFEEAAERYPEAYAALLARDAEASPPGGESHQVCRRRVTGFLAELVARERGRRVVVVSHELALYHLLRHVLGIADNPQAPHVMLQIDHCALHRLLALDGGVWKLVALNERAHLG